MSLTEQCLLSISRVSELQINAISASDKAIQEVCNKYDLMKSINPDIIMEDAPWYVRNPGESIFQTILLAIPRLFYNLFQWIKQFWDKLVNASKSDLQKLYEQAYYEDVDKFINELLDDPDVRVELIDKENRLLKIYYNTRFVSFAALDDFIDKAESIMFQIFDDSLLPETFLNTSRYSAQISNYGELGTTYLENVILPSPRFVSLDELVGRDASSKVDSVRNFAPEFELAKSKLDKILTQLNKYIEKVSLFTGQEFKNSNIEALKDPVFIRARSTEITQEGNEMRKVYTKSFKTITDELDKLVLHHNNLWKVTEKVIELKSDILNQTAEKKVELAERLNGKKKLTVPDVVHAINS